MLCSYRRIGSFGSFLLMVISFLPLVIFSGCSKPAESDKSGGGIATGTKDAKKDERAGEQVTPTPGQKLDGRAVLNKMAATYRKAKTYQDNGIIRLTAQNGEQKIDEKYDFSVAFERPNKIHQDSYSGKVRCDGKKYHAFVKDLPGQVIEKNAPAALDMKTLYCDPILAETMCMGCAGSAPQSLLLLEDKSLDILLNGVEPTLGESGQIGDRKCYRVEVALPNGKVTFWIDQESFVLWQIVLPTDRLRNEMAQEMGGQVENLSVIADFTAAEFDRPVDPVAFAFEMPDDPNVQAVSHFIPPHPGQLAGKTTPDFKITDLAGKEITPKSLAGKVAVLWFWSIKGPGYEQTLLDIQKLFDVYRNNDRVAICAVNLDADMAKIKDVLEDISRTANLHLPIYRNLVNAPLDFNIIGFSTAYVLGSDGIVQDFEYAGGVNPVDVLPKKIDAILAGKNLSAEAVERYQKDLKQYEKTAEDFTTGGSAAAPPAKVALRSEPKTFKLRLLWKCTELKSPGNILVVNEGKRPRIFAINSPNEVVELGLDGKPAGVHKIDLAAGETIANLRSFTTAKGKTYMAAFASTYQRMALFDLEDKLRWSYPADALQNPHSGIADVELCDLDDDGEPEVYVGYWGVVGVHCVGLDGKRLWGNRSLANVARMASGPVDPSGHRDLICMNIIDDQNMSLMRINAQGRFNGEISVGKWNLRSILGAALDGSGTLFWCAVGISNEGHHVALGFDLHGNELWQIGLSSELPTRPIEPIIAGHISRGALGEWFLPQPDGSIQIIAADGKPLDSFNTGTILQGLATVEIGGKPSLVIASTEGLEAFSVE